MNDTVALDVKNLNLDLGGKRVLANISLSVRQGEFVGVVGPNGGGKTSFLRTLVGILKPTKGNISWYAPARQKQPIIGYVPQSAYINESNPFSALQIVIQGAAQSGAVFGQMRKQTIERAKDLMKFLSIDSHLETSYVNLSGGEQRRCLLARALMRSPSAVLLDEPTTGVDQDGHSRFCNILNNLSKEGVTIILVSHDIPVVSRFSKRIAYINKELSWEECLIN